MFTDLKDYDVFLTKDGRKGSVLIVYEPGVYYADFGKETSIMEVVTADQIAEIVK